MPRSYHSGHRSSPSPSSILSLSVVCIVFVLFIIYTVLNSSHPKAYLRQEPSKVENKTMKSAFIATAAVASALEMKQRHPQPIPRLLYGTAWKKDRTEELVTLAIQSGFRGVDTACQPKHYYEPGVGAALEKLINERFITREDIFLQTKFTPIRGQDPDDIPYDKNAPLEEQVQQSFQRSLLNLKTEYLDSLVLHSPLSTIEDTIRVWKVFERFHDEKKTLNLGVSNLYDLDVLKALYNSAKIKPSFLQNRFYKQSGFDRDIRKYCHDNNIQYQSFWTLTANPNVVKRYDMTYVIIPSSEWLWL